MKLYHWYLFFLFFYWLHFFGRRGGGKGSFILPLSTQVSLKRYAFKEKLIFERPPKLQNFFLTGHKNKKDKKTGFLVIQSHRILVLKTEPKLTSVSQLNEGL